jgi:hypothetical protein
MSDIDPEKLEQALFVVAVNAGAWGPADYRAAERMVMDAARAHLATLPKWKEVEREYYEVTDVYGNPHGVYSSLGAAESIARLRAGRVVVRLTGTAKVRA